MQNLDLREIPVAYINLDRDTEKKLKIETTLQALGFKNISRVAGVVHPTGNRAGCSMAQHNALHEFEPPFIIVEDDATPLNFKPIVSIPDDADAVYLGVSSWGRMNGHSGPFVQYESIDDNLFRVYNMLGTHAILYLDKEYVSVCKKVSYKQYQIEDYIDIGFTDVQKYYKVYSFDNPLFYQQSSNGTNKKLSSYPTQECFTFNKQYFLPARVY
jgi:hypothetical protein